MPRREKVLIKHPVRSAPKEDRMFKSLHVCGTSPLRFRVVSAQCPMQCDVSCERVEVGWNLRIRYGELRTIRLDIPSRHVQDAVDAAYRLDFSIIDFF